MVLTILLIILGLLCFLKAYLWITHVTYTPKVTMAGKTVIITGANSGIGYETALALARLDARIIMACRNMTTAEAAKEKIVATTKNHKILIKHIDLSSLQSVRRFADNINATESRIDVLIHNAGLVVMQNQTSVDGLEMTMATNHYGPFLLTHLLIDLLKRSAPSRIVVVASRGHDLCTPHIDLNPTQTRFPYYVYFKSKLANMYFAQELARRLEGSGVTANSLHPGIVNTDIFENINFWPLHALFWVLRQFMITPPQGAQTTVYLATAEEVASVSGKYFSDCRVKKPWRFYENEGRQKKFFDDSQQMVGLRATDPKI